MKRISGLAALAAVAVLGGSLAAGSAASASGGSGHGGDGGSILRSGLVGSLIDDQTLFGVRPGGAPWVLSRGSARLERDGTLRVDVKGLVVPPGGTNPLDLLQASVACNGMVVATTRPVAFSDAGDARIRTRVKLPHRCLAPAVMLNPGGNAARYIAVTGAAR